MKPQDEREFVEFVSGSSRSLRRTAYLLTGDWHRADDVLQTALIKLYVAWPRVARSAGFSTYARRALVNCAIDESRRPWRRERSVESHDDRPDQHDGPAQVDDRMLVIAALAALAPRQRATVVLRYYDDLSVDETAAVLGCTPGTVKSQTARGLDTLRANLLAAGVREPITVGEDHL